MRKLNQCTYLYLYIRGGYHQYKFDVSGNKYITNYYLKFINKYTIYTYTGFLNRKITGRNLDLNETQ